MESKLRQEDTDEWFYESLKRYKNLYMFELEAPVDQIEIIDDISLCITGIQNYSKKCEILQMSIPPKLLPKSIEDGLCKDRDFKIISGGYSSSRVAQVRPIESENMVIATQYDQKGLVLFNLGDYDHGMISEGSRLILPNLDSGEEEIPCPGQISTRKRNIVLGDKNGRFLVDWSLDEKEKGVYHGLEFPTNVGGIVKIKYWDDNIVSFCTSKGLVCNYDLRDSKKKPQIIHYSSKVWDQSAGDTSGTPKYSEINLDDGKSSSSIIYSFDTIPEEYTVGLVDSCGGLEFFDCRKPGSEKTVPRIILPDSSASSVLQDRFNLEFQKKFLDSGVRTVSENNAVNFIVNGFKHHTVDVYQYQKGGSTISPIFTHDGHTKTVTHALWHPIGENLLFSASIDSVLHAWQYIVQSPSSQDSDPNPNSTAATASSEPSSVTAT